MGNRDHTHAQSEPLPHRAGLSNRVWYSFVFSTCITKVWFRRLLNPKQYDVCAGKCKLSSGDTLYASGPLSLLPPCVCLCLCELWEFKLEEHLTSLFTFFGLSSGNLRVVSTLPRPPLLKGDFVELPPSLPLPRPLSLPARGIWNHWPLSGGSCDILQKESECRMLLWPLSVFVVIVKSEP